MAIADWTDIVPSFVRVPLTAYKHRHAIQEWWKRLAVATGLGKTQIVITGRAAAGKSVLRDRLLDIVSTRDWETPGLSRQVESDAIRVGEWHKIVSVIPGQEERSHHDGMKESFSSHDALEGVIHVVDWGYTPIRNETIRTKMIQEDGITALQTLRDRNLKAELDYFGMVCKRLAEYAYTQKRELWLMIAATKADLYLDQLAVVQRYYHPELNSNFTSVLQATTKGVSIRTGAAPVCGTRQTFEWNTEVCKPKLVDSDAETALARNFFEELVKVSEAS
jgi:hypothetical protein